MWDWIQPSGLIFLIDLGAKSDAPGKEVSDIFSSFTFNLNSLGLLDQATPPGFNYFFCQHHVYQITVLNYAYVAY